MSEVSIEKVDVPKLARAYVALALAQDEANRYLLTNSAQAGFLPVLTSLGIAVGLLEEILENAMPEKDPAPSPSIISSNMVM
jgi:hypothetical protein